MTTTETEYYAVVTFGSPSQGLWKKLKSYANQRWAERVAAEILEDGRCQAIRIYECDTQELAESADISEVRPGERIVRNIL
jgi:hypothetical protein